MFLRRFGAFLFLISTCVLLNRTAELYAANVINLVKAGEIGGNRTLGRKN